MPDYSLLQNPCPTRKISSTFTIAPAPPAFPFPTRFDAFKVTPVYGLVVKPWQHVSFYVNHIEALQPGPTASSKAVNAGQVVGIVQSKQNEVGVKMDFGRVGGTLALFEIKKPVGMLDDNNVYGLYGEQRSRGRRTGLRRAFIG